MKNVLMLTNGFPPHAGVEASRAAHLAKYLPDYGWQPHVVCSHWTQTNCPKYDPHFGGDRVKSYVVATVPPPADLSQVRSLSDIAAKAERFLSGHKNPSVWTDAILRRVNEHLQTHTIDAVWATYPFRATLYAADRINRAHEIPWIADFRDIFEQWTPRSQWWFERRNERAVVRSASKIVTVSLGLGRILEQRYTQSVECLPNGFDPEEMETVEAKSDPGAFSIVHTGSITPPGSVFRASPSDLFVAVDNLAARGLITLDEVMLMFYGATEDQMRPHLNGCACSRIIKTVPWLPRHEIFSLQKGAGLLLLLGARMPGIITAKLFEYLSSGRPIMVIPPDHNGVDDLLKKTRSGAALSTTDEIEAFLLKHYQAWKSGAPLNVEINAEEVNRYSRKKQAGVLAGWLNEISR